MRNPATNWVPDGSGGIRILEAVFQAFWTYLKTLAVRMYGKVPRILEGSAGICVGRFELEGFATFDIFRRYFEDAQLFSIAIVVCDIRLNTFQTYGSALFPN